MLNIGKKAVLHFCLPVYHLQYGIPQYDSGHEDNGQHFFCYLAGARGP